MFSLGSLICVALHLMLRTVASVVVRGPEQGRLFRQTSTYLCRRSPGMKHGDADLLSILIYVLLNFTLLRSCEAFPKCSYLFPEPAGECPWLKYLYTGVGSIIQNPQKRGYSKARQDDLAFKLSEKKRWFTIKSRTEASFWQSWSPRHIRSAS